ncbi:hypothetical protein L2U69_16645, partial [Zavarzinia compransoris]|nr:hypothetical protein [Zavarzinia marina]
MQQNDRIRLDRPRGEHYLLPFIGMFHPLSARRHSIHLPNTPNTKRNFPPEIGITDVSSIPKSPVALSTPSLTHLQRLEAESIHIMREVVSETERPVMLYSVGKDSAVMLHLAQ